MQSSKYTLVGYRTFHEVIFLLEATAYFVCLFFFLMCRSLSALKNFAGAESPRNLGAGVINLDSSDVGRSFATAFIHELSSSFSGSDWGANGPGVITRVLQRICQVKKVRS